MAASAQQNAATPEATASPMSSTAIVVPCPPTRNTVQTMKAEVALAASTARSAKRFQSASRAPCQSAIAAWGRCIASTAVTWRDARSAARGMRPAKGWEKCTRAVIGENTARLQALKGEAHGPDARRRDGSLEPPAAQLLPALDARYADPR